MLGTVAGTKASLPVLERSVEPRVQPILITVATPVPVGLQVQVGIPLTKGCESTQTITRAAGNSASTRANHSVICAFAMSVLLAQLGAPDATFRQ